MLTERGLEPAVRVAGRPRAAARRAVDDLLDERLPGPVEAAAYYVVAEALTNVAKYACASEVTVGVGRSNGHACDRGARRRRRRRRAPTRGSGLRGLADRVEALGGRFVLDSPPGAGTTLRAEIPGVR